MARITAIGGVFFQSPDPKALAAWYRDILGLKVEEWGGAMIPADEAPPAYGVWSPFKRGADVFSPSSREFMINFAVDDLDGFVVALVAKGIEVKGRQETEGMGKFAWILDPDGTKVELWEPDRR